MSATGWRSASVLVVVVSSLAGCIKPVPPVPFLGYGPPYRGTGEGIYVTDVPTGWEVREGSAKITPEQALEASGDPEYEARRQVARAHNDVLYREGLAHRRTGTRMVAGGVLVAIGGAVLGLLVPQRLRDTDETPATATMPERRDERASSLATASVALAWTAIIGGTIVAGYGYRGGSRPPPYYFWRMPGALDRPAYVRQHVEEYNERIGASSIPGGGVLETTSAPLAPGQRRVPLGGPR